MIAKRMTPVLAILLMGACTQALQQGSNATTNRTEASPVTATSAAEIKAAAAVTRAPAPRPAARASAAQLDTTTGAQKAEAAKPAAAGETKLGTTVASLGDATQPGFWIKTPLVKEAGVGRVVNPANGKSSKVDLIPLSGPASGGSQLSLPALQLLGISLTDLPTVEVYRS